MTEMGISPSTPAAWEIATGGPRGSLINSYLTFIWTFHVLLNKMWSTAIWLTSIFSWSQLANFLFHERTCSLKVYSENKIHRFWGWAISLGLWLFQWFGTTSCFFIILIWWHFFKKFLRHASNSTLQCIYSPCQWRKVEWHQQGIHRPEHAMWTIC